MTNARIASEQNYTWKVGDKCLIVTCADKRKWKLLEFKHKGPYEVIKVNDNGVVKIKSENFEETINIRRLILFNEWMCQRTQKNNL